MKRSFRFVKQNPDDHEGWVSKKETKKKTTGVKEFDDIPIYTMTMVIVSNWIVDIEKLFHNLPITPFTIIPKKRGRKKGDPVEDPNKDIPIGSVISIISDNKHRGVILKEKKRKEKKTSAIGFRNSISIVIKVSKDKFINTKLSKNGKFQVTGSKDLSHTLSCLDYMWRYIQALGVYRFKNEETVPRCVVKVVMTNINYHIGYSINRQALDMHMNTNTRFVSIYIPTYRYSGVNIKFPAKNHVDDRLKSVYWNDDGKMIVTQGMYRQYLNLLSDKDRKKEENRDRYHTWLIFQSGSVIQSGPNYSEMKKMRAMFMDILQKHKYTIQERVIQK